MKKVEISRNFYLVAQFTEHFLFLKNNFKNNCISNKKERAFFSFMKNLIELNFFLKEER